MCSNPNGSVNMDNYNLTLGERIAIARKRTYLTQQAFANRLGVSALTVRRWESGESSPAFQKVDALSKLTGTPIAFFSVSMSDRNFEPEQEMMFDGSEFCVESEPESLPNFSISPHPKRWEDFL